jgi:hypothetical protein
VFQRPMAVQPIRCKKISFNKHQARDIIVWDGSDDDCHLLLNNSIGDNITIILHRDELNDVKLHYHFSK